MGRPVAAAWRHIHLNGHYTFRGDGQVIDPGYHRGGAGVEVTKFSGVWAYKPEQEMYEATAGRLVEELRISNSSVGETVHHPVAHRRIVV
jgi:hypothetical protein